MIDSAGPLPAEGFRVVAIAVRVSAGIEVSLFIVCSSLLVIVI